MAVTLASFSRDRSDPAGGFAPLPPAARLMAPPAVRRPGVLHGTGAALPGGVGLTAVPPVLALVPRRAVAVPLVALPPDTVPRDILAPVAGSVPLLALRATPAAAEAARLPVGLFASTIGHAGVALWVAFGAMFLVPDPQPEMAGVEVSLISGAAFDALMAASQPQDAPTHQPPLPDTPPFADLVPVPAVVPKTEAALAPVIAATRPVLPAPLTAVTPTPPVKTAAVTPAIPVPPVAPTTPLARAAVLAPVGAKPTVAPAAILSDLAPVAGALTPATLAPTPVKPAPVTPASAAPVATTPAPTRLAPLPDMPEAQVADADTPRPRARPDPAAKAAPKAETPKVAEQKMADPKPTAKKPVAEKPAKKPAEKQTAKQAKPAATTKGEQEANARRGAADGTEDGQSDKGKAKAKGKVAGNAAASNYGGEVLRKISRTKKPKAPAKGVVVIGFNIAANGGLASAKVIRSSGAPALDAVALDHIRRAAPFPAPPEGAKRSFSFEFVGRP